MVSNTRVDTTSIDDAIKTKIMADVRQGKRMAEAAFDHNISMAQVRSIIAQASHDSNNRTQRDGDGWTEARVERAKAMHDQGLSLSQVAKALQISKMAVHKKLIREGKIVPSSANSPIERRKPEDVVNPLKYHPMRYEFRWSQVDMPLEAGHPLSWGAISKEKWKVV